MSHATSKHPANRLARETSPYLLQHAHNPVDWFPWGDEAFAEARRRGVPIFLSIGYSTCYWCHVMERECFESEAVAAQMNKDFVCIKVDREERPDLDDIYMAATQMTTGHGGWPMSVFLEPAKLRPFYCGTYFPPEPRQGMRSFPQILAALSSAWSERRDEVVEQSQTLADAVTEHLSRQEEPVPLGLTQVSTAAQSLIRMLDRIHGGFGSAPKFPQPVFLELLLDIRSAAADDATRDATDHALRLTLDKMAQGGMNDQIGGGFHRYSVDEKWLVPHFEKMLYDNAQLAAVYARAADIYGDDFYTRTCRRTLDYVLKEMTQPSGAFSSAQDAEVDGREGANYVWTPSDLAAALSPDDAQWISRVYGLDQGSNFRDPHHPQAPATNVLFLPERPNRLAQDSGLSLADFHTRLDHINTKLYQVRAARKQPRLDDKVLTSWNGMMIAALARAGTILNEPRYTQAAAKAADFILTTMRDARGLLRTSRSGTAKTPAFLEDYAYLIDALLALHSSPLRASASLRETLPAALELTNQALKLFTTPSRPGLFDTRDAQQDLFVRPRSTHDGALPSGSSVMLANLITLHDLTKDRAYLNAAISTLDSMSASIADSPISTVNSVRSILRLISTGRLADTDHAQSEPSNASRRSDSPNPDFTPVEIYAATDRIQVGQDHPATLRLVLRIADGYHINAADPGPNGQQLIPLRVGVINGTGITAFADYPPGEKYNDLLIHKGSIEFDIAVEQSGDWRGRPLLAVTFQACTDTECLAPVTAELDVAIDRIS